MSRLQFLRRHSQRRSRLASIGPIPIGIKPNKKIMMGVAISNMRQACFTPERVYGILRTPPGCRSTPCGAK